MIYLSHGCSTVDCDLNFCGSSCLCAVCHIGIVRILENIAIRDNATCITSSPHGGEGYVDIVVRRDCNTDVRDWVRDRGIRAGSCIATRSSKGVDRLLLRRMAWPQLDPRIDDSPTTRKGRLVCTSGHIKTLCPITIGRMNVIGSSLSVTTTTANRVWMESWLNRHTSIRVRDLAAAETDHVSPVKIGIVSHNIDISLAIIVYSVKIALVSITIAAARAKWAAWSDGASARAVNTFEPITINTTSLHTSRINTFLIKSSPLVRPLKSICN